MQLKNYQQEQHSEAKKAQAQNQTKDQDYHRPMSLDLWGDRHKTNQSPSASVKSVRVAKKPSSNYKKYKVKADDSIIGLSLKLNINEQALKDINSVSEDIFPGMVINLPSTCDLSLLGDINTANFPLRPKLSQLLKTPKTKKATSRYDVYFCCAKCKVKGVLTLNPDYLIFTPSIPDSGTQNESVVERLAKYNCVVDTKDIKEAVFLDFPTKDPVNGQSRTYGGVEIHLYSVGNKKLEHKYRERLDKLKIPNEAIAKLSFHMTQYSQEKYQQLQTLLKLYLLKSNAPVSGEQPPKPLQRKITNTTQFEILHHNEVTKRSSQEFKPQSQDQNANSLSIELVGESMLSHRAFTQIAINFPLIYQFHNWSLLYSCMTHGTSLNTLVRQCRYAQPLLLVIKEHKGNSFGAFLVDELEFGRTGRGEMFIWGYDQETKKVEIHKWTGKNEILVFIDQDGMGIGMGQKYGIWVNTNLDKGSSASTETFGNSGSLSRKQQFLIENVEVWGIEKQTN